MNRTIEKIASLSTIVEPHQQFTVVTDDPDDDRVLECAVEGKVDFVISNDKHLLKLKEFQGIGIVTPEEFLKHEYER